MNVLVETIEKIILDLDYARDGYVNPNFIVEILDVIGNYYPDKDLDKLYDVAAKYWEL